MNHYKPGQKWISSAEPDLGMGQIVLVEHRLVSCYFDLAEQQRSYAREQAPLSRVKFTSGDEIRTLAGQTLTVSEVLEQDGLFVYQCKSSRASTSDSQLMAVAETQLDPNVRFNKPEERLFTHQLDDHRWFNLRYQSLIQLANLGSSANRGLYGARVSLIAHQLYIANEVGSRYAPRVLLADEVGLGKTIEAGMIIHQQLQTGRANRVLIIVPPALTFQWFVEMIRRFNLQFTVLDEERCMNIVADNRPEHDDGQQSNISNPFDAQQLILCSLDLFRDNQNRLIQALESEWDLVVVDEAHHLDWSPEKASSDYLAVEQIAGISRGLLLLTATPEQLGRAGHFARLRLLDPHRYAEYESFVQEEKEFENIAEAVNQLLDGSEVDKVKARLKIQATLGNNEAKSDQQLIAELNDQHGTGRVLFRNVRSSTRGFPQRVLRHYQLAMPPEYVDLASLYPETLLNNWLKIDPRVSWLTELVGNCNEKYLLICAHQQTAIQLEQFVRKETVIRSTLFHEGMDLVARDRAANYFSETYKGAQLMVCSEIGSEGRNFQFASNLILFDLPLSPDLLEQRIGRLDRIGQQNDVMIHVPLIENSAGEELFLWYHQSLDLFAAPNPVAQSVFEDYFDEFTKASDLATFFDKTQAINSQRRNSVRQGRDRLLELNSQNAEKSAEIIRDIKQQEQDPALEQYMECSFDLFGLESEPLADGIFSVKPTETMVRHTSVSAETMGHFYYPELPEEGISITYQRSTALAREDISFFTWENPMVQQALDVVMTDTTGNSTMVVIKHPRLKAGTVLLEALHVVSCIAAKPLMVDRYMPPEVIRTLIDPAMNDLANRFPVSAFDEPMEIPDATLHTILESQKPGLKKMLLASRKIASTRLTDLIDSASDKMHQEMKIEIDRLKTLRRINGHVRLDEIEFLEQKVDALNRSIEQAQLRIDALRIIVAA